MILYGNSVDSVAGQQQALDNYFMAINQSNRQDANRAAAQAADYAFRARALEDQDMLRAVDAQNRAGEFAFNAGQQQAAAAKADALARYQFGANKAMADREFGLREKEFGLREQAAADVTKQRETVAPFFAERLGALNKKRTDSAAAWVAAQEKLNDTFTEAEQVGAYDVREKKLAEGHPAAVQYANLFRQLKTLNTQLEQAAKEAAVEYRQQQALAEKLGFRVDPDTGRMISATSGEVFQFGVPSGTTGGTPAPTTGRRIRIGLDGNPY